MATTEDIINKYPAEIQLLAFESQAIILKLLPAVKEFPDEKANIIGYGYSDKYIDLICTIILSKKGIKLGLNKGTELTDPKKLLEGTGKVHKYVQISTLKDLKDPALKNLLKAGYKTWQIRARKK